MACCHRATSHYFNQCWSFIDKNLRNLWDYTQLHIFPKSVLWISNLGIKLMCKCVAENHVCSGDYFTDDFAILIWIQDKFHFFGMNWYTQSVAVTWLINSSPPRAAYKCQWTVSALVQIMACRLYGTKPLSEPMLDHYQLDPWEQSSVKFFLIKIQNFSFMKMHVKISSVEWGPFCPEGDELMVHVSRYQ